MSTGLNDLHKYYKLHPGRRSDHAADTNTTVSVHNTNK